MVVKRAVLESYTREQLKDIVKDNNVVGYSLLKKKDLIDLMLTKEHRNKWNDIDVSDKELEKQKLDKVNMNFLKGLSPSKRKEVLEKDAKKKNPRFKRINKK